MKQFIKSFLFLTAFLSFTINAQTINENLKILEPLLTKTWVGELKSPDGTEAWETKQEYSLLWDGTIVKFTGSTPEINANSERYFYWNRDKEKIIVLILNERGIYQKGFVTLENMVLLPLKEQSHSRKKPLTLKTHLKWQPMVK